MADPDIDVLVDLAADPDPDAPEWTSLADRLHYGAGGQEVSVTVGRQDEQAEVKPTEMSWALQNWDNLFTPNNVDSPYLNRWEQGRRCRVVETVDGEEFILGSGFLQIPDMAVVDEKTSQPVTVTTVDWMGWLDSVPPFDGTLAEHVRSQPGLVLWLPLSDPYPHMSYDTTTVLRRRVSGFFEVPVPREPDELIRAQSADGPPGDDQSYALWDPALDAEGDAFIGRANLRANISIPIAGTDVVALSVWARATTAQAPTIRPDASIASVGNDTDLGLSIHDARGAVRGTIGTALGLLHLTVGRELEREAWRLLTVRLDMATGSADFWLGADGVASGTITPPVSSIAELVFLGELWSGAMGHVQVRVGPGVMTRAEHLAQHRHGYRGLQRQTVAERIRTLAAWAGVPASEVDVPDACSTPMQVAKLAGVGPAAAIRRAAATGQDTPLTTPAGAITAVPRGQRYNQAVEMTIPWGWIRRGSVKARPDPPVSDVVVTRTGGGTARRSDPAAARRHGVRGLRYELDSAVDEDAANLAAWALAANSLMRTRSPSFVINMLNRSLAERKDLLRLRVGHRIEITGMPAGSPADLPHLIVQGIRHTIGPGTRRLIQFNTSPLLGPDFGVPPACPIVGGNSGSEVVLNGRFVEGSTGWTGSNATIGRSADHAQYSGSLLVTPNGSGSSGGANQASRRPVAASTVYVASIWVYATQATQLGPAIDWYQPAAGSFISSSIPTATSVPPGVLTQITANVTSPSNAGACVPRARHQGATTTGHTWWVSEVSLIEATVVSDSAVIAY